MWGRFQGRVSVSFCQYSRTSASENIPRYRSLARLQATNSLPRRRVNPQSTDDKTPLWTHNHAYGNPVRHTQVTSVDYNNRQFADHIKWHINGCRSNPGALVHHLL